MRQSKIFAMIAFLPEVAEGVVMVNTAFHCRFS